MREAVPILSEELDAREYLTVQRVEWDEAANQIIVEIVEYWEDDPQVAASRLREELVAVMSDVLVDAESYRVELLDVQPLDIE